MPDNHYAVASLPAGTAKPNKTLLRAGLVSRNAYCLAPDEDSQDLIAVDPDGAGTIPALIQNGHIYSLDDADTTTAHDGVVCLVSNDSKRYKLDDLSLPYSVLTKGLTAPPMSPVIGAVYLIYGSPTGAWAGHPGEIAIYTARGWAFALAPIGFKVYVEDEDAYYYMDVNGDWLPGLGAVLFGANTVPLSAIIGCAASLTIRVENQTTNSPPSTWSKGVAYIIGGSASGDWAGHAGSVAVAESDGVLANGDKFTIYQPATGDEVFDKNLNIPVRFNGTAWESAAGGLIDRVTSPVVGNTGFTSSFSNNLFRYGTDGTPTTGYHHRIDSNTIDVRARRSGAKLKFTYHAHLVTWSSDTRTNTINADWPSVVALFRDNETSAIDFFPVGYPDHRPSPINLVVTFVVDAIDDDVHTYGIRVISGGEADVSSSNDAGIYISSSLSRFLECEVYA